MARASVGTTGPAAHTTRNPACVHRITGDVFSFCPDVFSFCPDVFSFRPDVFTFRPNVFTFEGHVFSFGQCASSRTAPLRQAQGKLGKGLRGRGDVSTLSGQCVQFWALCVNFSAECVQSLPRCVNLDLATYSGIPATKRRSLPQCGELCVTRGWVRGRPLTEFGRRRPEPRIESGAVSASPLGERPLRNAPWRAPRGGSVA